jgi:aminomethyltransferase
VAARKTPLYDKHVQMGGKMVEFAGFYMPVQYGGIVEEHRAVRHGVGVFDVSHMGEFTVSGERAVDYLNAVTTNDVSALEPYGAQYSAILNDEGGVVDDLVLYRRKSDYLLVVNAANTARDFEWLTGRLTEGVELANISEAVGQIAVQGPGAEALMGSIVEGDISGLGYYHSMESAVSGVPGLISRTGYTGEDGFEVYVEASRARGLGRRIRRRPRGRPMRAGGPRHLEAGDGLQAARQRHGRDHDPA